VPSKKPPTDTLGKPYKMALPCPISGEALHAKSDALAQVILDRLDLKEKKREANAQYREQNAHFDQMEETLAHEVRQHTESRDVEVFDQLILETQTVETVRSDTMEVVKTRPAEAKDLQAPLAGIEPASDSQGDGTVVKLFGGKKPASRSEDDDDDDDDDGVTIPEDSEWTEGSNPRPIS